MTRRNIDPSFDPEEIENDDPLGEHVTLLFEDELTIRYQIQEMLRIEKIFEEDGIRDELDAYNPLIPDGRNFKATMMIEYEDANERKAALARLKGVEDRAWVQVEGLPRVFAIADEDLDRENDEKTSAVHFLRFELDKAARDSVRAGAGVKVVLSGEGADEVFLGYDIFKETRLRARWSEFAEPERRVGVGHQVEVGDDAVDPAVHPHDAGGGGRLLFPGRARVL